MKTLKVKDLVEKLLTFDQGAPVIILDISSDDEDDKQDYPITESSVGELMMTEFNSGESIKVATIQFCNVLRENSLCEE